VSDGGLSSATDQVLELKRRRLGTALHQLAVELAQERRKVAQLERELERLRVPASSAGRRQP
jgi:hypothetical protein